MRASAVDVSELARMAGSYGAPSGLCRVSLDRVGGAMLQRLM